MNRYSPVLFPWTHDVIPYGSNKETASTKGFCTWGTSLPRVKCSVVASMRTLTGVRGTCICTQARAGAGTKPIAIATKGTTTTYFQFMSVHRPCLCYGADIDLDYWCDSI